MDNQDTDKILNEIKQIISKVTRININEINDNASLREDLSIDSLQSTQIITLVEDKFDVKIDEIEIFNVESVHDIIDIIDEYKE